VGVSFITVRRWESGEREPRASDITKLCAALGCTEAALLNGPAPNEIRVEIIIRRSDDLNETEEMDLSKDAPYLESLTLTPHKTGLKLVFDKEKTLREICETIMQDEEKFENTRKALYGEEGGA
jgi:transcriptional regulator with XRE-family HTH domain